MRSEPIRACIVLLFAAAISIAPVAQAGLGDLVKSAKDKAAKVTGKKSSTSATTASDAPVEYDDQTLELTDARVVAFLAGHQATEAARAKAAPLYTQRQKLQDEINALQDAHGKAISVVENQRNDALTCWSEVLGAAQDRRSNEMQEKMMADPVLRGKFMAMAQRMGAAQASGDTLALRAIQQEMLAMAGPSRADTLAAQQKCGAMPAPHPMQVRIDGLQDQSSTIGGRIRAIEDEAVPAQAKASGMDGAQFAMARERIEMYLSRARAKQQQVGLSAAELQALTAHHDALEAALNPS